MTAHVLTLMHIRVSAWAYDAAMMSAEAMQKFPVIPASIHFSLASVVQKLIQAVSVSWHGA